MSSELPELALTAEELEQILAVCQDGALLVGGQALAFWAQRFEVRPPHELYPSITSDADFIGDQRTARRLGVGLRRVGWGRYRSCMADGTFQTSKLARRVENQGIKQIDFLGSIIGLSTESIQKRAVRVTLPGGMVVLVLHPLDV